MIRKLYICLDDNNNMIKLETMKRYGFLLAIAIVLVIFVNVGVNTFYKPPKYEDFCAGGFLEKPYAIPIREVKDCKYIEPSEELKNECKDVGDIAPRYNEDGCIETYYCETCNKEFNDSMSLYNRNVFIILSLAGVLSIVASLMLANYAVVNGLLFGGIINILIGIVRYWSDMDEYFRFIISGVILAVLIFVAYKRLK